MGAESWITPGGFDVVLVGTLTERTAQKELIEKRWRFCQTYCAAKGWPTDTNKLSLAQVLEINAQDEWKYPK